MKFEHAKSGRQVDVCFDQESGLASGEAAKVLMRQMAPVREVFASANLASGISRSCPCFSAGAKFCSPGGSISFRGFASVFVEWLP